MQGTGKEGSLPVRRVAAGKGRGGTSGQAQEERVAVSIPHCSVAVPGCLAQRRVT